MIDSLHHLRHRGHEVIVFHILDEAEVHFPFDGMVEFEDVEQHDRMTLDAKGMQGRLPGVDARISRNVSATSATKANIDYVGDGHERELRQGAAGILDSTPAAVLRA